MNLLEALTLSELRIYAGGQGSGPNAPCPQCGPKHGNVGIKEGDVVKIKKPITVWNQKTGNNDTYHPGKKVIVLNVLPKVGHADQMISVQVHKHHDAEYMKMNDVELHKSVGSTIEPEEVQKSKIKVQYISNDGAQVTVVKTNPETKEYDPLTLQEMAQRASSFKGSFDRLEKVGNLPKEVAEEYMPDRYEAHTSYIYDASKPNGTGTTVWVHRYPDHVTVQEQHYMKYGHIDRPLITWRYDNVEKARKMLSKRYSIKVGHKELKKL